MKKEAFVYILTNYHHTVLYTGVTSNLSLRLRQHKTRSYKWAFTSKYNATQLVYYEHFESIDDAIRREKQIKAGSRQRKIELINRLNPDWKDLSEK